MRSSLLSAAGGLTLLLTARVAGADEAPDAVRAAALFTEGRRLMALEYYADACPKLAESQALDPAPDTAFDLGICYEKASQAAFKAAHEMAQPPSKVAVRVRHPRSPWRPDPRRHAPGRPSASSGW